MRILLILLVVLFTFPVKVFSNKLLLSPDYKVMVNDVIPANEFAVVKTDNSSDYFPLPEICQSVNKSDSAFSYAKLVVNSPGADIFIDGHPVGNDKFVGKFPAGSYVIRVQKGERYIAKDTTITLREKEAKEIKLTPAPREGTLTISVVPEKAADAEIYIDDELKGKTPLTIKYLIGTHKVSASKLNYLLESKSVNIKENLESRVELRLLTQEEMKIEISEDWKSVRKISLMTFGGSSLISGILYWYAEHNYSNYNSSKVSSVAMKYRNRADNANNVLKVFTGIAGTALIGTVFSWFNEINLF